MIPAFILNKDLATATSIGIGNLNINPEGYTVGKTLFGSLQTAIVWALTNDEDVIYCICDNKASPNLDYEVLENVIYNIVTEGINVLYIDAGYAKSIQVNNDLKVISEIVTISSFIILRPAYNFIRAILVENDNSDKLEWLQFFRLIAPHSFALNNDMPIVMTDTKFHIISPFRNAEPYITEYLQSVHGQLYNNYHIYLIDDCSTDGSSILIPKAENITHTINASRKYALQNIVDTLLQQTVADDDVICLIDADDLLPHKYVLNILNTVYQNSDLLLTYGSYRRINTHNRFRTPYNIEDFSELRTKPWKIVPLRTFRFKVFKELLAQDPNLDCLKDNNKQILKMPYDMALFFPLMEIAGYKNIKFIDTILYEYRIHENNDQYKNRPIQYEGEQIIRAKKRMIQAF